MESFAAFLEEALVLVAVDLIVQYIVLLKDLGHALDILFNSESRNLQLQPNAT